MEFNKDNYHWTEADCTKWAVDHLQRRFKEEGIEYKNKESMVYIAQRMGNVKIIFYMTFSIHTGLKEYRIMDFMNSSGIEDLEIEDEAVCRKAWNIIEGMKKSILCEFSSTIRSKLSDSKTAGIPVLQSDQRTLSNKAVKDEAPKARAGSENGRGHIISEDFSLSANIKVGMATAMNLFFDPSLAPAWSLGRMRFEGSVEIEKDHDLAKRLFIEKIDDGILEYRSIRLKDLRLKAPIGCEITSKLKMRSWSEFREAAFKFMEDGTGGTKLTISVRQVPAPSLDELKRVFTERYFATIKQQFGFMFFVD